jgi:hypothetical protein
VLTQTHRAELSDGVLQRVRERVQYYFPDVHSIREVRVINSVRRSYSNIHWVRVYADGEPCKKLIVKISETAALQFVAMKSLWPQFDTHATWKIPRPLDYLAQDSALIMEEFAGTPLLDRLPRIFWHHGACQMAESDCRRAGQWLRFYHDAGRATELAPLNAEGIWPGLDETLEELEKTGFKRSLQPLMDEWFVPLVKRVVTELRPISNVHGDFTADNVMMNHESVVVLDLTAEFRKPIDLDIASFLNSILMLRLTRPVPSAAINRMRQAFLTGYFGADESAPMVICFLQGIGLADIALEIVQRRPSNLVHKWVERAVGSALEKVIGELRRLL